MHFQFTLFHSILGWLHKIKWLWWWLILAVLISGLDNNAIFEFCKKIVSNNLEIDLSVSFSLQSQLIFLCRHINQWLPPFGLIDMLAALIVHALWPANHLVTSSDAAPIVDLMQQIERMLHFFLCSFYRDAVSEHQRPMFDHDLRFCLCRFCSFSLRPS